MKTAMQELKEWLLKMPKVPMSRDLLISKILIGEEKEKQQIIDAFKAGYEDGYIEGIDFETPENYYTKTYNNEYNNGDAV